MKEDNSICFMARKPLHGPWPRSHSKYETDNS